MSKGEILEHKGEGLYRVRQKLAVERIQQELAQVQTRLAELAVELPTAKLELIHADDAVRDKAQEIDALIPDYAAGADGALQQITALQTELIRLQSEAGQQRLKVAELIAEDLANRKRQNQLEQVPEGREMDLWCADYSVELTGEVGLVDINDEGGQGTLVQPGFEDAATYDATRDGALFPNLAQSGAQIYLNAALLPGVQKWRPRYRIGTITKLSGDVCNVDLDPAQSSAQDLNINQAETLQQVPIKYMDCNGFAFEENDRVLVRFTQSGPLVVGFARNPKDCGLPQVICTPMLSQRQFWTGRYYGPDFENSAGEPINPPLGQANNFDCAWVFDRPGVAGFEGYTRGYTRNYGMRNWIGKRGSDVLSWHGPPSRICDQESEFETGLYSSLWPTYGRKVYYKNREILDLSALGDPLSRDVVDGAAIVYRDGARFLRVCASNFLQVMAAKPSSISYVFMVVDVPWNGETPDTGAASVITEMTEGFFIGALTGMYFSSSGEKGAMMRRGLWVLRFSESNGLSLHDLDEDQYDPPPVVTDSTVSGTFVPKTYTLGFEFDGESEVPVTINLQGGSYFERRTQTGNPVYIDGFLQYVESRQYTYTETFELGGLSIKYGSKTLFSVTDRLTSSISNVINEWGGDSDNYQPPFGSYSEDSRRSMKGELRNHRYFIDARFGVFAGTVVDEVRTTSASASKGGSGTVSGTAVSNDSYKTMFEVYLDGEMVFSGENETEVSSESASMSGDWGLLVQNSFPYPNYYDADDAVSRFTYASGDTYTAPRLNAFTPRASTILQASCARTKDTVAMAFEFRTTDGDALFEPVRFAYFSGAANPVQKFMERDIESGYLFANISLI